MDKRTATAQTLTSLKEKKENLVAQLQALKDEHEKETAQESAGDESSKGLDSMDSYMLDMKRNERLARGLSLSISSCPLLSECRHGSNTPPPPSLCVGCAAGTRGDSVGLYKSTRRPCRN